METDTLIHRKDESKLQSDLVELNRKINHWRQKESEVTFHLCKYLNKKADILNELQANKDEKELIRIFNDAFNNNIEFEAMSFDEFLEFANDFMHGKTEYYKDDYFLENYDATVSMLLEKLTNN